MGGARDTAQIGVFVEVATRIAELVGQDAHTGCADVVGGGREGGGVDRAAHGRPVAQCAAGHIHIGLNKVTRRFGQGKGDGFCARVGTTAAAGDGDLRGGFVHQRVVLCGGGHSATGAGDGAVHGGVGVVFQVGKGHLDTEAAVGGGCGGVGDVLDGQGDDVACRKHAGHFAGDRDLAGHGFAGQHHVVSGDRVDAERRLGGGVAGLQHITLRCGAQVSACAVDASNDLFVSVGRQIAGQHADAVAPVGCGGGGVVGAIDQQGDDVAFHKGACDLASQGDVAGVFGVEDDVVAGDRLNGQGGLGVGHHRVTRGDHGDVEFVAGRRATGIGGNDFDRVQTDSGGRAAEGTGGRVKGEPVGQRRAVGHGGGVALGVGGVHVGKGAAVKGVVHGIADLNARLVHQGQGHGGCVVGAVDGDGEVGGFGGAAGVACRVGEHVRQRAARLQGVHGAIAVVQRVGVGAVGPHDQGAVLASDAGAVAGPGGATADGAVAAARGGNVGDAGGVGVVAEHACSLGGGGRVGASLGSVAAVLHTHLFGGGAVVVRRKGGGDGVDRQAHAVVGFLGGAAHAAGVGVFVQVTCCVGKLVRGHTHHAGGGAVGGGGEHGGVHVLSAAVHAHMGQSAQAAAADFDVASREVAAGFTQGEGDGGGLSGSQAGLVAADGDGGGRRVVAVVEADLVVALDRGVAHAGQVGVGVEVARSIAEFAGGHTHGGHAHAVGGRCEQGGVHAGVDAVLDKVAQRATGDIDIGQGEVTGSFAEGELDGFTGTRHGARAGAGHHHGGRSGVGVVGQADLVVGFGDGARQVARHKGVEVAVACGVGKFVGSHAHGAGAHGVGRGGEGGAVGAARAGEIAERAAGDGDVGQGEVGGRFTEGEVDDFGAIDQACSAAADHHGGRGGVRSLGVVGHADLVVGFLCGACHTGQVGVFVQVACGVGKFVRSHAHGGGASAVGGGGEGGGVLGVAAGVVAAGADRGKVAQGAAADDDVADVKAAGGFAEREADGFCTAQGAAARSAHHDGGWGVVGVDRQADQVVGFVHIAAAGRVGEGVLVQVACRVGKFGREHADGGRAQGAWCGGEGGGVGRATALEVAECAAGDGDVGQGKVGGRFAEGEVDRLGSGDGAAAGA